MTRQWLPATESRLTLLFALRALGPVRRDQLERFVLTLGLMNYFDLEENLAQLETLGQIEALPHPAGPRWQLSEAGGLALETYEGRIPVSRREAVLAAAPVWAARFRHAQDAPFFVGTDAEGRRSLRLEIVERNRRLLSVTLTPAPAWNPEAWPDRAPALWRDLLTLLSSEPAADAPRPAPVALTAEGWAASLAVPAALDGADLTLTLWSETEAEARRVAAALVQHADKAVNAVARALEATDKSDENVRQA